MSSSDDEDGHAEGHGLLGNVAPGQINACGQTQAPSTSQARAAVVCYFLLGAGLLAPWNAFLTAIDYFSAVYGPHMDRLFTICYLPTCLVLLLVMLHLGPHWAPLHTRITTGFVGFVGVTVLMPLVDALLVGSSAEAPTSALAVVLGSVLATGVLDGISQGAVFVDAARAGQQYTHAAVGGTACSGVLICALRLATKAAFPGGTTQALRSSTALYFAAAAVLSAAGLVSHLWAIPRLGVRPRDGCSGSGTCELELTGHHAAPGASCKGAGRRGTAGGADGDGTLGAGAGAVAGTGAGRLPSGELGTSSFDEDEEDEDDDAVPITPALLFGRQQYMQVHDGSSLPGRPASTASPGFGSGLGLGYRWPWESAAAREERRSGVGARRQSAALLRYMRLFGVAKRCWPSLACLFITYTTTLSVFPGVLAEDIQSKDLGAWLPLLLISLFNLADAVGKLVPISTAMWSHHQHWLLVASLARLILLLPALVFAAVASAAPAVIAVLTALFGLSNGYLTAIAMTLGPSFALEKPEPCPPGTPSDPSSHGPSAQPTLGQTLGLGWLGSGHGPGGGARGHGDVGQGGGVAPTVSSQYVSLGSLGRSESGGGMLGSPRRGREDAGGTSGVLGHGEVHGGHASAPQHRMGQPHTSHTSTKGWGGLGGSGGGAGDAESGGPSRSERPPRPHGGAKDAGQGRKGPCGQSEADMAEDLCVVSLVSGLTVGAVTAWLWLLLPHA